MNVSTSAGLLLEDGFRFVSAPASVSFSSCPRGSVLTGELQLLASRDPKRRRLPAGGPHIWPEQQFEGRPRSLHRPLAPTPLQLPRLGRPEQTR
jgi:hypothetical protein